MADDAMMHDRAMRDMTVRADAVARHDGAVAHDGAAHDAEWGAMGPETAPYAPVGATRLGDTRVPPQSVGQRRFAPVVASACCAQP